MEVALDFVKFFPVVIAVISFVWWLSGKFQSQFSAQENLSQKLELGQKSTEAAISATKDNLTLLISQISEKQVDLADRQAERHKQHDRRFDELSSRLVTMENHYRLFEKESALIINQASQAAKQAEKCAASARKRASRKVASKKESAA